MFEVVDPSFLVDNAWFSRQGCHGIVRLANLQGCELR